MSENLSSIVLLDSITLAALETDTQLAVDRVMMKTYKSDKLNLACKYTVGSAESSNVAEIKLWGYIGTLPGGSSHPYASTNDVAIAADEDNWIQLGTHLTTAGDALFVPTVFKIAGAASGTTYPASFLTDIAVARIRVSALETGVSSVFGTLTVVGIAK